MACDVIYKGQEFTTDSFKEYVEANLSEFQHLLSPAETGLYPLGITSKKNPDEQYWDISKKKFDEKKKIIDDSGAKLGKYGHYYWLSKEQQRQYDNYKKRHATADPGTSKQGFELYKDLNQTVFLKKFRNKHYLYIDLKHLVNSNGVLLPRVYGRVKFPIDLIYHGELDKYVKSWDEEMPFVSEQEAQIRKHLFKTKTVSAAKAANFYLFNIKDALVKLVKDLGGKVTYEDLSNMKEETIDYVKSLVDIDKKVAKLKEDYNATLEQMDEDELREQIMSVVEEEYDADTVQGIWSLINVLPAAFLRLISFDYIDEATAFFMAQDDRNVLSAVPNVKSVTGNDALIWGTSINVALRRMLEDGIISQEDVDLLNKALRKEIDAHVKRAGGKLVDYNELRSFIKKSQFIKKLSKLVDYKGSTVSASYVFDIYREQAMNDISEYAVRQNKGLVEVVRFLGRLQHQKLNKLFTNVTLGTFEGMEESIGFPLDYTVIAAHELGHALDFYLQTTKKDTRAKLNAFITALTDMPEFKEYLRDGLHSRGYKTSNTKEIAADLYAWFMAKSANYNVANSHIATLDTFMYANEKKVEQLFKDIFEIKPAKNQEEAPEGVVEYIQYLIRQLIDWVNDSLNIDLFSLKQTGIEAEPAGLAVQRLITALDRLTMRDDTFDAGAILDSDSQGSFFTNFLTSETDEAYSSISDLEEGLKQAATDKAKFDTQIERLLAESTKINNIIGQIKEPSIRTALRDAVRYIRQDKTDLKNFAYFLLEAKEVLKFYSEDLRRIVTLPINEAVVQLDNSLVVSRAFKDTINFLKKDFRYADPQNEFKKLVDELASYYDQIQNIYTSEAEVLAFKFMSEELSGDAKIAYDELKAQLDNLLEQKAKAVAAGSKKSFLDRMDSRIEAKKQEIISLVPDAQTIEDVFKGLRGDLNWFTGNFRSTLAMGDPIVSGYARRLKRGYNQVRAVLTPIRNMAQDQFDKYMAATGHSTLESMEKVYEGLYKISNHVVYNDKGEPTTEQYYSLLGPIEEAFYNDDAKYRNDIKLAKNDGDLAKIEAAQKAYSEWQNKYTERKYVSDWYDRYNLLTPQAYDARQKILDEINNKVKGPNRDALTDADYERIGELKQQLKALGSTYENGQPKTGEALAIAQSMQAFNKETARMSTWEVTEENQRWFDIIVAKKRDQVSKGILSQAAFDNWYAANTQRVISPEFYTARQIIIDKIQSIMSKLPQQTFQGDIKKLWETIIDVSRPYRDEDNVLVGSNVSAQEGAVVRSSEVAIEELKAKLIRFSGLTIAEEQELQGLWGTLDTLSDDEINRFMDLRDESDTYKDYMGQYISKEQLLTLFQAFAELAAIQKYETTDYYKAVYQSKLREYIERTDPNRLLDVSESTLKFEQEDQWYLDNHITKTKKMYQDGKTYFTEVNEPLYIWKDILPTNEKWVEKDQPGFAFKTRLIKPEFINSDYQSMNFEYFKATEPDDFKLIPKRNVDGKISSYISEDYERLKRSNSRVDQAKMDMLRFLTDTHLIGQQQLPKFKRLGYALPGVVKTKYDRVREQGLAGAKTAFGENFRVTQEDRDLTLGDISQIDLSIIPVKYSTKVKPEDQDLNLLGNVLKHRAGVEEYSYLEKELPYAKVIQSALRTAPGDVSDSMVDRTLKLLGKEKFIKATKESQRSKTFDSFLRTMFYGETEVSPFNSDTWNKRINSAFGLATLQVMTFNFPAHITNILSGEVQNIIESVGGKYMTMGDYFKAKSIYASNVGNFWKDYGKEGNKSFWTELAERFDVPQGEYLDQFGRKSNFSRLRDLNSHVMFIKQGGEHEIQVSTMIAMALNKKVKLNGSVVSLNDALEMIDGHIRIKAGVTKVDDSDFTEVDMNIFQDQVHSVVRALNGAYAKIDKSVAEKSFLGKLAFYMRKYFLPMAYRRFEPFKYDYEERDFKEGYYQTAWRILGDVVKMNTDLVKNWSIYQDTLTDEEKVNLRRFMAEIGIIGILALTILLIGGYDDDRKFKGRWLYTMAVYELMKVRSETETFIPLPGLGINELTNLFSSPFVPATTAKTAGKFLSDLTKAALGDDDARFKRDYGVWSEGDLRFKADALKLLGIPVNLLTPELMVKNFELRNR